MASTIELLIIFLTSFGTNLIPFAGPSNLFIASNAVVVLSVPYPGIVNDTTTLVIIGVLVAIGSTFAKSIHYLITFFVSKHLSQQRQERLQAEAEKTRKWAFLLLYAAAATPIPDEPIVIPLGLMKYSPTKFFTAYFLGKLTITIPGALLGAWSKVALSEWLSPEAMIAISITLTILITIILLKIDVGKIAERIFRRIRKQLRRQATNREEEKTK
jgi:membrane protein YqaA with SNARE-associated domain